MRIVSLGQSQESSTLVELRGTRVLLDAGLSLAASARLVQREVAHDDDEGESKSKSKNKSNQQRPHTTGQGEFLIAAPAYRTAVFEVSSCVLILRLFRSVKRLKERERELSFFVPSSSSTLARDPRSLSLKKPENFLYSLRRPTAAPSTPSSPPPPRDCWDCPIWSRPRRRRSGGSAGSRRGTRGPEG